MLLLQAAAAVFVTLPLLADAAVKFNHRKYPLSPMLLSCEVLTA